MKKLKDTKLGQWLKEKAPKVLDKVGDLLPDNGVLGMVKNIISGEPDLPPEIKAELEAKWMDFELEILRIQVADTDSARGREIDFIKATGHLDRFMLFLGMFIMLMFAFCMYVTVFVDVPVHSREMFIEIRATSRDALLGLVTYYWGSSVSSRLKDMKPK